MNTLGLDYLLKTRGLSYNTLHEFNLGYCDYNLQVTPDNTSITKFLSSKFKHSIIIPVHDLYSDCIGITSRKLNPFDKQPKCFHSEFEKSAHLFNLNRAYPYILENKCVFLVEGPFDCMSLWEHGYKNVVALLGTSMSDIQASLLCRFTRILYNVLDNDVAGNKCTIKISKLLESFSIKSFRLLLEDDPDVVMLKDSEVLKNLIKEVNPNAGQS